MREKMRGWYWLYFPGVLQKGKESEGIYGRWLMDANLAEDEKEMEEEEEEQKECPPAELHDQETNGFA